MGADFFLVGESYRMKLKGFQISLCHISDKLKLKHEDRNFDLLPFAFPGAIL